MNVLGVDEHSSNERAHYLIPGKYPFPIILESALPTLMLHLELALSVDFIARASRNCDNLR